LRNDGYHAIDVAPEDASALVERLRARRPEPEFVVSLRVGWDVTSLEPGDMAARAAAYRDAGIDALLVAPDRGDLDTWLAGQERLAGAIAG
jgi:hypothetical protein